MKIIEVKSCGDCPFCEMNNTFVSSMAEYYCADARQLSRRNTRVEEDTIPKWCKLRDKKHTISVKKPR